MRFFTFAPLVLGAFLAASAPTSAQQTINTGGLSQSRDVFTPSKTNWLLKTNPNKPNTVQVALDSTGVYPLTRQLCQHFAEQLGYPAKSFSLDSTTTYPKADASRFLKAALKSIREQNGSDIFSSGSTITLSFNPKNNALFTVAPPEAKNLSPQTYSTGSNSFVAIGGSSPQPDTITIGRNNILIFKTDGTVTLPSKQFPPNTANVIQVLANDNLRMLARKLAAKHNNTSATPAKLFFADLPGHESWKELGNYMKAAGLVNRYMAMLEKENPNLPKDAEGNPKFSVGKLLTYTPIQ